MPHYVFVTGKLAEPALRRLLAELAPRAGFEYSVAVVPITVVALATTPWLANHLTPLGTVRPHRASRSVHGRLDAFRHLPVELGPKDLRDLPDFFGAKCADLAGYGAFDIEIIAEINNAPNIPLDKLLAQARQAQADGADIIDLGCLPGTTWAGIGDAVRLLARSRSACLDRHIQC